jgi:predicted unusual protein kinase regulating ubiquinone biosynthesis (AarF/ABC1/UbiB family)
MSELPKGRFGRIARLARSGAGMLLGGPSGVNGAAEALSNMRGLAAKLGQMASYVDGVVPEAQRDVYERALGTLRAQAQRSAWPEVHALLERELGAPLSSIFASFSEQPLASASIGQVHAARLRDGSEVAVKVQHPGIELAVESDLANASMLEGLINTLGGRRLNAKALLEEVRARFREELDYRLEASRAHAFAELHRGDRHVRVPRVFMEHSTQRVLVSEFVRGLSFEEACQQDERARRAWAETLWRFTFKSLLGGALLHADPHPGNYFFQADGAIAFLDYGCVQELSSEHSERARAAHRQALAGDLARFERAAKTLLQTVPGALEQPSVDYLAHCLAPLFHSPYRITRTYAAELVTEMRALASAVRKVPAAQVMTMPPHMLFMNRLQFGLYSVLARLDVVVDYAAVERAIFRELDGPSPTAAQL